MTQEASAHKVLSQCTTSAPSTASGASGQAMQLRRASAAFMCPHEVCSQSAFLRQCDGQTSTAAPVALTCEGLAPHNQRQTPGSQSHCGTCSVQEQFVVCCCIMAVRGLHWRCNHPGHTVKVSTAAHKIGVPCHVCSPRFPSCEAPFRTSGDSAPEADSHLQGMLRP